MFSEIGPMVPIPSRGVRRSSISTRFGFGSFLDSTTSPAAFYQSTYYRLNVDGMNDRDNPNGRGRLRKATLMLSRLLLVTASVPQLNSMNWMGCNVRMRQTSQPHHPYDLGSVVSPQELRNKSSALAEYGANR